METWTRELVDEKATSSWNEIIEFRTGRNTPDALAMLDERLFRLRPEFPLQLSFEDSVGHATKTYIPEYVAALSEMHYLKKLTLQLHLRQPFTLRGGLRQLEQLQIWPGKFPCDIPFIDALPNLRTLRLANEIKDFIPIRSLERLESLSISATVPSLDFLAKMNISSLLLDRCRIKAGWEFLASATIECLDLSSNVQLEDISFLESCASLKNLRLSQSKVTAFCEFSRLTSLEKLEIRNMPKLADLGPLSQARGLRRIVLEGLGSGIKARDFQCLLDLPLLEELDIRFLDFSEKQIKAKAVLRLFEEAGKGPLVTCI